MSHFSGNSNKRKKNIDETVDSDDEIPFVTFIPDKDCTELLYTEESQQKARRRRASSPEIEIPKHLRVRAILQGTPYSAKRPRLSTQAISIPQAVGEEDEDDTGSSEDDRAIVAKPRVLFSDVGISPTRKFSSTKNKERMEQKVKVSLEKYTSSTSEEQSQINEGKIDVTPKSKRHTPHIATDTSTPKSKRYTPQKETDDLTSRSKRCKPQTKQSTPKTPRSVGKTLSTPKTPRTMNKENESAKTPYAQRKNIKKNIKTIMNDEGSDESDWALDSSESSESDDSDTDSEIGRIDTPKHSRPTTPVINTPRIGTRTRGQTVKSAYKSDDYFASHGCAKVVTSDKTLNLLHNPRLRADIVQSELKGVPVKHSKEVQELTQGHYALFDRWMLLLLEGFNLLLHGLGSKASLMNSLYNRMLANKFDSIVINGFFTSLSIKDILKSIVEDIIRLSDTPGDEVELCDVVVDWFQNPKSEPLFLLLNNLDGAMLQSSRAQSILARLAATLNIHLIATIDHVNAPLLFDQAQLSRFNFVWQNVTNFKSYIEETAFENSMLIQQSGGQALASLRSVFQSLTSNAKAIFNIIMNKQLDSEDQKYLGITFKDLYRQSQDAFLVASESALRTHLTEFLDHHLVRSKRGHDGSDLLLIPIAHASLVEFRASQQEQ